MRIAYLIERDLSREDAIVKKLLGQVRCWREAGNDVRIFALSPRRGISPLLADFDVDLEHRARRWHWLTRYRALVDRAIAWQPSVVYFRFSSYFPPLGRLMRRVPTVVEINTNDLAEYRRTMTRRSFLYHRLTRAKLFRRAAGLVTVTEELAEHYRPWGRPVAVVPNGILLADLPQPAAPNNPTPRLVFLGHPRMPWHGVDKMVLLAQQNPTWRFDLVGDFTFGVSGEMPGNVRCHGPLECSTYAPILAEADVALGTLALEREQMAEASPLKVREYLAFGLPTIIGHRDSDFPDDAWFLLRLTSTSQNVADHLGEIREFVERMRGRRVPRSEIEHLDFHHKERRRLEFLAQFC